MVFCALRETSMGVSVGGCLNHNVASRRERKKEKVRAGPALRQSGAGQTLLWIYALDGEGYMWLPTLKISFLRKCDISDLFECVLEHECR